MRPEVRVLLVVGALLLASVALDLQVAATRSEMEERSMLDDAARYADGPVSPEDWDGDGIPDSLDACPARPETYNRFEDDDGCPDVVTTTRAS